MEYGTTAIERVSPYWWHYIGEQRKQLQENGFKQAIRKQFQLLPIT